ncbi:unnamed protein product [Gongylonema pulchrum]|uniref:ADH_zinc_N domain-containing protein n=1 Tax=Gongylonema pulchrum TaxID=637853 RepID=A0A183DXF0_9BILA|nr:unnamed protein product [Gongylonema pulchrum]
MFVFKAVKDGGRVVLVALGAERVEIPVLEMVAKEIDLFQEAMYFLSQMIVTQFFSWPAAIEMISSGKIKLDKLTRAHYKLEEAVEAFQYSQKGEVIKVFVDCAP